MGIEKNSGSEDQKLSYKKRLANLQRENVDEFGEETVAYARLGEEVLKTLGSTGEAPYASMVPNTLEYKLANFDDDLDDPLMDLKAPTGTTKFLFMVDALAKLGFKVHESLTEEEESAMVCFLDDFNNDQLPSRYDPNKVVNKFVAKAQEAGISRTNLNRIFNMAKNRRGVLIGLSQDFLDQAGEDAWDKEGNNHPSRYAKLHDGLKIDHISGILPLDETSETLFEFVTKNQADDKEIRTISSTIKNELKNPTLYI